MNISLTPELEQFVQTKVESGLYYSASEVVREGLRMLQEKEMLKQIKIEELKREVRKGLDSLDAGGGVAFDAEQIKAQGRKRVAQKSKKKA